MNKTFKYTEMIEKAIAEYLPPAKESDLNEKIITAMRYSLLNSGKRIRPILTLAFCELCGAEPEKALPFAVAIEMVHTYSLIHDDLPSMDNDVLRRGKACCHIVYGEAMALLAGDALLTKAFELVLNSSASSDFKIKAGKFLAEFSGENGMIGGQCIDLQSSQKEMTLEMLKEMDMGKTVGLIKAACGMGCAAAQADEKMFEIADKYAEGIGMAFQIQDDILDVTGNQEELGKSIGKDAESSKKNYVSFLGIEKAASLAKEYTNQAVSAISGASSDADYLKQLAIDLLERKS